MQLIKVGSLLVFTLFLPEKPLYSTPSKPNTITYSTLKNTTVYKQNSARNSHISIKISPPKNYGSDQFIFVEIYNETKIHLGQIDFDLNLTSNNWQNFEGHINGDDILPGRSALRKVSVGNGKGAFPVTKNIEVSNLKIYNSEAILQGGLKIYIDLVK